MPDPSPMFAAAEKILRSNPTATFGEVKEALAAMPDQYVIYPITYGRVKAVLGLVPTKERKKRVKPEQAATLPFADEGAPLPAKPPAQKRAKGSASVIREQAVGKALAKQHMAHAKQQRASSGNGQVRHAPKAAKGPTDPNREVVGTMIDIIEERDALRLCLRRLGPAVSTIVQALDDALVAFAPQDAP